MAASSAVLEFLLGVHPVPNSIFLAEPYDDLRENRERAIREALRAYQVVIADEQITNLHFLEKVMGQIRLAQYAIADVTSLNSNVLIELGIMYGLSKPTLLLLKRPGETSVPSNLDGVEQLRYSDFAELFVELPNAIANIATIARNREAELEPRALAHVLSQTYGILVVTAELMEQGFSARIVHFRPFEDHVIAVLDKGGEAGVIPGVQFRIVSVDETGVEEHVGSLRIQHVQEKIAVAAYEPRDVRHPFWTATFQGDTPPFVPPPNHLLRPVMPPLPYSARGLSVTELRENLRRCRAVARLLS